MDNDRDHVELRRDDHCQRSRTALGKNDVRHQNIKPKERLEDAEEELRNINDIGEGKIAPQLAFRDPVDGDVAIFKLPCPWAFGPEIKDLDICVIYFFELIGNGD